MLLVNAFSKYAIKKGDCSGDGKIDSMDMYQIIQHLLENSILEDIKLIVDESDERGMFILSGSQKLELMKGMSESLAGRVAITELAGLSLREIFNIDFNKHFVPTDEYLKEREQKL